MSLLCLIFGCLSGRSAGFCSTAAGFFLFNQFTQLLLHLLFKQTTSLRLFPSRERLVWRRLMRSQRWRLSFCFKLNQTSFQKDSPKKNQRVMIILASRQMTPNRVKAFTSFLSYWEIQVFTSDLRRQSSIGYWSLIHQWSVFLWWNLCAAFWRITWWKKHFSWSSVLGSHGRPTRVIMKRRRWFNVQAIIVKEIWRYLTW